MLDQQSELLPETERTADVVAFLAITADGYIAADDGSVEFLDKYMAMDGGLDFEQWSSRVGALIMGRASYEQMLEWGWAWGELPTIVMTNRKDLATPDDADVRFRAG